MLRSMTGFGKAEGTAGQKKFTVEIRSLNSKQLDLNLRMPGIYREKELDLRTWLSESILRGKADALLYYESLEAEKRTSINQSLMVSYYKDLKAVADQTGMSNVDFLNALMRIPDVMKPENPEFDEAEWKQVMQLAEQAYARFDEYRKQEGKKLHDDFQMRIANIMELRLALDKPLQARTQRTREKLKNNLNELIPPDKIDPNRFEQELIYYMERLDVSEEYQRLLANCEHFMEELNGEGQGKKLGFVAQEIGREINTIGSKANDSDMQRIVVMMKDELEKIKEQVNNVL
ncbi:MAG: YicC family protein [Flavobacteriales bacterium]|nr:YicC family protein [Flavobacteriales bacterium]